MTESWVSCPPFWTNRQTKITFISLFLTQMLRSCFVSHIDDRELDIVIVIVSCQIDQITRQRHIYDRSMLNVFKNVPYVFNKKETYFTVYILMWKLNHLCKFNMVTIRPSLYSLDSQSASHLSKIHQKILHMLCLFGQGWLQYSSKSLQTCIVFSHSILDGLSAIFSVSEKLDELNTFVLKACPYSDF